MVETASGLLNDIAAVGALASVISERIKQEIGDWSYCDDLSDGTRQLKAFTRKPKRLVTGKSVCENNDQFLEDVNTVFTAIMTSSELEKILIAVVMEQMMHPLPTRWFWFLNLIG